MWYKEIQRKAYLPGNIWDKERSLHIIGGEVPALLWEDSTEQEGEGEYYDLEHF